MSLTWYGKAVSYSKLFSDIVTSTVWGTPDTTRLVWITMLAITNRHGEVHASVPGLAHVARVTLEQCEEAIACLLSADPHSRTKDHGGRRIEPIDGGWLILNYDKYRNRMSAEDQREKSAERQRRKYARDKQRESGVRSCEVVPDLTPSSASALSASSASVQGEVQEREPRKRKVGLSWDVPCPEDVDPELWNEWLSVRKAKRLSPPTERAITKIRHDAEDRGMSLYAALQHCCERGYGGFYPDDDNKRGKR